MATINSCNLQITPALAGEINYNKQSCFLAYNSTNHTNFTFNSSIATVKCDTTIFDVNTDYNSSTGNFTAPVTGIYHFVIGFTITKVSSAVNKSFSSYMQSSGSQTLQAYSFFGVSTYSDANNVFGVTGSSYLNLSFGDICNFKMISTVSSGTGPTLMGNAGSPIITFFAGSLVC